MRKTITIVTSLLFISSLSFADEFKPVKSKITDVTVYLKNARIKRTAKTQIPAGISKLLFTDLSHLLNGNSIQVEANGSFTILSISNRTNYLNAKPSDPEIKNIEDSLKLLHEELEILNGLATAYNDERGMIVSNMESIKGTNTNLTVSEMNQSADFFRKRIASLSKLSIENKRRIKKTNELITKYQRQSTELSKSKSKSTGEIIVEVSAKSATSGSFILSYNVHSAGWNPTYDIRAKSINDPVTVNFNAKIYQNTGIDWKNINLSLSTGNPAVGGQQPILQPWRARLREVRRGGKYGNRPKFGAYAPSNARARSETAADESSLQLAKIEEEKADRLSSSVSLSQNQLSLEYKIKTPFNIPADAKWHQANIQDYEMKAGYTYYAVPKKEKAAFLLAEIIEWDQYNFLSGNANVYFEKAFVGKAYIDADNTTDTLDISLGRDASIVVDRKKIEEFCAKKTIGANKKETWGYELSVRNKKSAPINIEILDQVPISSSSDLEIETMEKSGARLDDQTGILTWELEVKSGETIKKELKYSMKFPKSKRVY